MSNKAITADRLVDQAHNLLEFARAVLSTAFEAPCTKTAATVSGAALIFYALNKWLSRRALNNSTRASFDWSKEIVLITGGAGGIGGETAKKLAAGGTTVVVLDLIPLTYKADNVHFYQCNLTDFDELQSVATRIEKEIGEPTVIVANAGICRGKPILLADRKDIQVTFGVNTLGLLWTAKAFLPKLAKRNHGHFLIVASQTAYLATAGATDYCASKAAALAIYEGLHSELKHVHKAPAVRISCISPSHVQTSMFTGIKSAPGMASMTPQRLASDIVDGILYSGNAHNILVPFSAGFSAWVRVLPDWLRVFAQDGAAGAFSELKPRDNVAKLVGDQK